MRFRSLLAPLVAVAALATGAACQPAPPPPPPEPGPTRYLDPMFDVRVTEGLTYGQAIDEHSQLQTLQLDL